MSEGSASILAGDIGGTHTRIAFVRSPAAARPAWDRTYRSKDWSGLGDIVSDALRESGLRPDAASFGVAGPVRDGVSVVTNLPWTVDARRLARVLGLQVCGLINDLEANAYGLSELEPDDLLTLQPGIVAEDGNEALISAGTGLGEAGIYRVGEQRFPFGTEGGHSAFAPADDLQDELLAWLRARHGHVSWERLVSGPGLHNLYRFLRDSGRGAEPAWLADAIRAGDPAAEISRAASEESCELAVAALGLFVRLYGSEAGNLALKTLSTAGLFVGGGIAPKISGELKKPAFLEAFLDKGRMRGLLESVPVRVVMNDRTALLGAALHARLGLEGRFPVRGRYPAE